MNKQTAMDLIISGCVAAAAFATSALASGLGFH
jgi:hypothetical protein